MKKAMTLKQSLKQMVETEKENNKSFKNIIKMLLKSKEKNSNTLSKISKRYDQECLFKTECS